MLSNFETQHYKQSFRSVSHTIQKNKWHTSEDVDCICGRFVDTRDAEDIDDLVHRHEEFYSVVKYNRYSILARVLTTGSTC